MRALKLLSIGIFIGVLAGCQTSPSSESREPMGTAGADVVGYTDAHIDYTTWKRDASCCSAEGAKMAVSSGGRHSSQCGLDVKDQGGNIIDVAVATAFCLGVERPHHTGLGGGGFLTFWDAKKKQAHFVDFRETAPKKATEKMFQDKEGKVVPKAALDGGLAVATPGFVAGLYDIHKKWGKLAWAKVVAPSVALARKGFAVYPSLAERIGKRKDVLVNDPTLKSLWLQADGVTPVASGTVVPQEALAKTLELVAKTGKTDFYRGKLAKEIVKAVDEHGGILSANDLRDYKVIFTKPLEASFDGYRVLTAPPPSAGGMIVLQTMQVLRALKADTAPSYSVLVHDTAEAFKRAFADRSQYVGDPAYYKDRTYLKLVTADYAAKQAAAINAEKATPAKDILPATNLKRDAGGNTTQLTVVDGEGNAVSSTITLNFLFGAGFTVPGTGIVLNDEMDDFSAKPGEPNAYGLTGSSANKVEAGKRPVSSMCPTIVLKNDKPVLALGAPGGSYIPTGVTTTLWNALYTHKDVKKAVFAPRIHHQWLPDTLFLEQKGLPQATLERLKALGHVIDEVKVSAQVAAVGVDPTTGKLTAVFDPRDEGGAEAR